MKGTPGVYIFFDKYNIYKPLSLTDTAYCQLMTSQLANFQDKECCVQARLLFHNKPQHEAQA